MSRNFQLLERLEKTQVVVPLGMPTPNRAPFSSLVRKEGVPRAEITTLIQRLFFEGGHAGGPVVVCFCGMANDDRSSWICARAAEYLASKVDASVCLVDADVGSPHLHSHFDIENQAGFAGALESKVSLRRFVASVASTNLWLIPAGSMEPGSSLLGADLRRRFTELRNEFDYVIVNCPPLSRETEAIQLAQLADGMVLIEESGWISRQVVRRTKAHLEKADVAMLGTLHDQRRFSFPNYLYGKIRALKFPHFRKQKLRVPHSSRFPA